MNWLRSLNPFARTKPAKIKSDLLYEAQRNLVLYEAAAEEAHAMARMYRMRVMRLSGQAVPENNI